MQESFVRYLSAHNNTLNPLYNNQYRHTIEAFFIQSIHDQLKMVLENGISVEVFPIPDDNNAATLSGIVSIFNTLSE